MKKLLTILIFSTLSTISIAQMNNMAVGLNGTISVPIGDFNDVAKMGFGVSGSFFYELMDNFEATGSIGFLSWGGDKLEILGSSAEVQGSFTSIPILVGGRYILNGDNLIPYISGELGFHIFSTPDQEITLNDVVYDSDKGETNLNFGFGIGGGVLYELSREVKIDGGLKYNIISADDSIGHFSLSVGFIVGIN